MKTALRILPALVALLSANLARAQTIPRIDTPPLVQVTLGPTLSDLPGFGSMYCVPTSTTMELLWLGSNGFGTLAPTNYDPNNPADLPIAYNLDLVLGGLMGTTALKGTEPGGFDEGIQRYLDLQGFSGLYTVPEHRSPTAANLGDYLTGYNINIINIAWYADSGTSIGGTTYYNKKSGHDVALLTVNGGTQTTINNPEPASLLEVTNSATNVQQTVTIGSVPSDIYLTGTSGEQITDTLQFITTKHTGTAGEKSLAIIDAVSVVQFSSTLDPSTFTPQTFDVSGTFSVNTNGGSFTTAAPIVSDYLITKAGSGTMTLGNTVQGSGGFDVTGGVLESTTTNADSTPVSPFGGGDIRLASGGLAISPAASGSGAAQILVASGSNRALIVDGGGNSLALNRGGNSTLTVQVGGHQGDALENLTVGGYGTLQIVASDGPAGLGGTTKLMVVGSGSNLPATHNGIVTPAIVGQENNADASGVFLGYSDTNGFAQAATTDGNSFAGTDGTTIFQTTGSIAITGSALVAGLIANHDISGDTLQILPDGAVQAGLILNHGATISASQLDFGDRGSFVYSSKGGGTISSVIHTTDSLATFGPGETTLSGTTADIAGRVYVNSGTLRVENRGVGSSAVTVTQAATLKIGGIVSGTVTAQAGATILLAGGTMAAAPILSTASTLGGNGLVQSDGALALLGNIGSTTLGGQITFQASGTTTVATDSSATVNFTLTNLMSGTGAFSQDWTGFIFVNDVIIGTDADPITVGLNFSNVSDPDNPSDPGNFWQADHAWRFLEFDGGYAWSGSNFKFSNNSFYAGTFGFDLVQGSSGAPSYVNLTYAAAPEPAAWSLLSLGAGLALLRYWRRLGQISLLGSGLPWRQSNSCPPRKTPTVFPATL
ncbi:hypothetical protein BH09VER1_BH09VER1_23730 [soil metagenome]